MTAPTLVYFGDSLTDNGNLYDMGAGLLPDDVRDELAGPTGAVSDGPTHASYTEDILGADVANYAVAAAEAVGTQTLGDLVTEYGYEDDLLVPADDPALDIDINLSAQVDRFLADAAGQDLSQTSAILLIGGNDFQNLDFTSPSVILDALTLIDAVVAAQVDAALDLFAAGVGTVWFSQLPVAEFFAGFSAFSAIEQTAAVLAADLVNDALEAASLDLSAEGHDVRLISVDTLSEAVAEDPSGFGFLAPYADTLMDSDVLDAFDPDQVAFYDSIHPSTAMHGVLGAFNAHVLAGGALAAGDDGADDVIDASFGDLDVLVLGLGGNDQVTAEGGNRAILFGGTGNDSLTGGTGADLLSGGADDDELDGGAGDDVLAGGLGNDILRGMRGNDVLVDSLGDDLLRGGKEDDVFIFTDAALLGGDDNGINVFVGGDGVDTLYVVLDGFDGTGAGLLEDLGIRIRNIENVVFLDGRDALSDFAGEAWYDDANVWGLI